MNMRKKIARAMYESHRSRIAEVQPSSSIAPWEEVPAARHNYWLGFVDAVLDAMEEPSRAIELAMNEAIGEGLDFGDAPWKAAIRAAKGK